MAMLAARQMFQRFLSSQATPIQTKSIHFQSKNSKASSASLVHEFSGNDVVEKVPDFPDPAFSRIDLSFENAQEAYKSKYNSELLRALLVFNMCSIKPLVEHNKEIMKLSRRLLGSRLFCKVMQGTFYGQFVAGEDVETIRPCAERNRCFGVKSILDYSVEKDISKEEAKEAEMESCLPEQTVSSIVPEEEGGVELATRFRPHEEFGDRREGVTSARTYFYENEELCDDNMNVFLRSIDCVSGATNATGFAAIKMTALGRPQLLLQLSEVLTRVRRHFDVLSSVTGTTTGAIKKKDFERYLRRINLDKDEVHRWYTILDITNDGEIDLLDWHNLLEVNVSLAKLLRVPDLTDQGGFNKIPQMRGVKTMSGSFQPLVECLTDEEEDAMKNMLRRLDTIVKYGKEKDVRVMIDAEQTYFQPAINRLTVEMMRKYNKEKAIVFNTYQCYLKESHSTICTDLALACRESFFFGAKIVRGAYLDQERLRAHTIGYEDPINPSFEATTAMYEKVVTECMTQILKRPRGEIAVMIATHNEDSIKFTLNKMQQLGIHSTDKVVCFGQLLGMCDQVSFSLGQAGYSVYKYVPYGPVEEVLPYLSRRALENKGILKKVRKEKMMLRKELWRRIKSFQFFYTPTPPDVDPLAPIEPATNK